MPTLYMMYPNRDIFICCLIDGGLDRGVIALGVIGGEVALGVVGGDSLVLLVAVSGIGVRV